VGVPPADPFGLQAWAHVVGARRGSKHIRSRVAPRSFPLGAPTDPDVQNSRIRLLKSQLRCSIHRADAPWLRERVALQQHAERVPVLASSV